MEIEVPKYSWLNLADLLESNGVVFWGQTEYPDIPITANDKYINLTQEQAKRIDLVAHDYYGDANLFWAILLANNIDYPTQLREGLQIRLPARDTIDSILQPTV